MPLDKNIEIDQEIKKNRIEYKFSKIVIKISILLKFSEICEPIGLAVALAFSCFISSILIFKIRSSTFSVHFSACPPPKPCQLDHFRVVYHHFVRVLIWLA